MNLCKIDFSCYLDRHIDKEGCLYNNRPIFTAEEKLKEYSGQEIRIFVTPVQYKSIIYDLLRLSQKYNFSALCYVPEGFSITEMNFSKREETYIINASLSYFRKKLFSGNTPTILSNECSAGAIYQTLGLPMISPTINVGLLENDFIKLCQNPKHYFSIEVTDYNFGRVTFHQEGAPRHYDIPCSKIDDITVYWAHCDPDGRFLKRWNVTRKKVNYDNLICCMSNSRIQISQKGWEAFSKLPYRHLAIKFRDKYIMPNDFENTVIAPREFPLWQMDTVIENYFDILGWIMGSNTNE